jgi:hypothetical protein
MDGESYVKIYDVQIGYDPRKEMGFIKPWFNNGHFVYTPTTALAIASEVNGLPREQGVDHLERILRSPVKEDWAPPQGLSGQPPNISAVRPKLNNASDFAEDALVALGEMQARRPRHRRRRTR